MIAFGHFSLLPGINASPYIDEMKLQDTDEFLIIASSSFWEVCILFPLFVWKFISFCFFFFKKNFIYLFILKKGSQLSNCC